MKALTYLQLSQDIENPKHKALMKFTIGHGYYNALAFYSQPFAPELITKYFEGWKEKKGLHGVFYRCGYYDIIFSDMTPNCMSVCMPDVEPEDFIKPETLDDFIRDCQRAGIELEWEQIKGGGGEAKKANN